MFGKNPISKADRRADGSLQVKEVFATLQGEGPFAGMPSIFVRLAGCNLRCWFCDTDFEGGPRHSPVSLVNLVSAVRSMKSRGASLIVLTGGEPFRQNIVPFIRFALDQQFEVQIETAGTLWNSELAILMAAENRFAVYPRVSIVCSPKTPRINSNLIPYCLDYKYIVSAKDGVDPTCGIPYACQQSAKHKGFDKLVSGSSKNPNRPYPPSVYFPGAGKPKRIWLQPCDEQDEKLNATNRDLCVQLAMQYGYRLSLQQHKILNLP